MSSNRWSMMVGALAIIAAATSAAAQSIASRVDAVRDGTVQMTFAARPDVCSDGDGSIWMQRGDRTVHYGEANRPCITGPVRVSIGRDNGQTVSIRKCVACRSSGASDVTLTNIPADEAARYLLGVARTSGGRNADEAIDAAAFADAGDLSAEFTRLVRDENATMQARKQALFWFGQLGESTKDLVALDGSLKGETLREQFTFVLSQRRDDPALDKLMDIARKDSDMKIRKQAMFWLGQSHDPRAIQFFRDVLRR